MNKENLDFLEDMAPERIKFYAAGVQFRPEWKENLADVREGDELRLTPEPTNQYDSNAVMISTLHAESGEAETFLGYVPAKKGNQKNLWVKEKLLEGKQLRAIALEINTEASPWQALLVEVGPIDKPEL